ncbi:HEAT repeat domain-containing protein [Roseateles sp.]|uniref:HEAT repeat domain-containing protein n=1 Tax=Roseateles sp. TaxID=1971397 RepID=UPI003267EE0D
MHRRTGTRCLIRIALREWDRDRGWAAIHALRMRGSPKMLVLARTLAGSRNCRRRALGLLIASQLRERRRDAQNGSVEFALEETQQLLLAGLHDPHAAVLSAAISGLGHRPHPAARDELVQQAGHRSASIRLDVAVALGNYGEPPAVDALLKLARDPDDDVRDWATFALGSLHDIDTPEVRQCLWENLQDTDADVRGEAIVGLAERRDPRAVDHLLAHLGDNHCDSLHLNAALKLVEPKLLPALQALLASPQADSTSDGCGLSALREALKASASAPSSA